MFSGCQPRDFGAFFIPSWGDRENRGFLTTDDADGHRYLRERQSRFTDTFLTK